jgi:hypothetical protein
MTSCTGETGQHGTLYTYAQLEGLWIAAGGAKGLAPVAAAIAEAESGGCSASVNPTDNGGTQTSWGLWQISNGTHAQPVQGILNPSTNAQAAVAKYKANGWQPWGTYTSGAYKAFLNGKTTPDLNVPAPVGTDVGEAGPAGSITGVCLLGFTSSGLQGTSWLNDLVGTGGNIGQGQLCFLRKSQARALIGGVLIAPVLGLALVGAALLAVQTLSRNVGGLGHAAGGAAEIAGAGLALAGMPEAGAPVAAAGSQIKGLSGRSQGRAGKYAQRRRKTNRQNASEDAELQAKGASNISAARKPRGTLTESDKPRRRGSVASSSPRRSSSSAPRETAQARSRRLANPPKGTGRGDAPPF